MQSYSTKHNAVWEVESLAVQMHAQYAWYTYIVYMGEEHDKLGILGTTWALNGHPVLMDEKENSFMLCYFKLLSVSQSP